MEPPRVIFFKQRVFWGAILKRPGGEPCVFPSQAVLQLRGSNTATVKAGTIITHRIHV